MKTRNIALFTVLGLAAIGIPVYLTYKNKGVIANEPVKNQLPPSNSTPITHNNNLKASVIPTQTTQPTTPPEGWKGGTVPVKPAIIIEPPKKTEQQKWAEEFIKNINSGDELRKRSGSILSALASNKVITGSQQSNLQYGYIYQYLDKNQVTKFMPVYYQMYDSRNAYSGDTAKLIIHVAANNYHSEKPLDLTAVGLNSIISSMQTLKI